MLDRARQRGIWFLLALGIPSAILSGFVNHLWDSSVGYLLVVAVIASFLLRNRKLGSMAVAVVNEAGDKNYK